MQNKFDLDKGNMDPERTQLLRSIDSSLAKVYRDRKSKAHAYFKEIGGPANIPAALNNPLMVCHMKIGRRQSNIFKRQNF